MSLLVAYHGFDRLLSSIIDVESYDYRFRAGYTRARRKTLPLRSKTHESDSPLVESRRNKDTKTLSTIRGDKEDRREKEEMQQQGCRRRKRRGRVRINWDKARSKSSNFDIL